MALTQAARTVRDQLDATAVFMVVVNADGTCEAAICSDAWTEDTMRTVLHHGGLRMHKVIEDTAATVRQMDQN